MSQVIFAINEMYFTGDGNNIRYIDNFEYKPVNFGERVKAALYPTNTENMFENQRQSLIGLISELEELVRIHGCLTEKL